MFLGNEDIVMSICVINVFFVVMAFVLSWILSHPTGINVIDQ